MHIGIVGPAGANVSIAMLPGSVFEFFIFAISVSYRALA